MEKILVNSPHWLKVILINIYGFVLAKRRFSGSFYKWYNLYKSNLQKSPATIKNEQFELLKKNLIYAFENITYYNRIFKEVGFDPYNIKSMDEIKKIPFLTKDIIRDEFENLYNKKIKSNKYILHTTSGSTGQKLKFLLPKELFYKKNTAFLYRFYHMWGIKPKDKRVTIGGRVFTEKAPFWIYNWFEKQLLISAHHLSTQTVASCISKIESFNPIFIQGHPSAILVLAKYIIENKKNVNLNLKGIFTTGETLFEDDQKIIEKAFKCSVAQQYGSGENCFSAQQAPNENGYLINYEHGLIETIGEGDLKEVVVTSFQNEIMPFIRYKMNDYVRVVNPINSKNNNLPILFDEVVGRVDDVIKLKNGSSVLPVTVRMNLKALLVEGTNYQLVQDNFDKFTLNLNDIEKKLNGNAFILATKKIVGSEAAIKIYYTESLITKGGKIRNVISRLK